VEFASECDDVAIAELAAYHGLRVFPLSDYGMGEIREKGLIIGYAYAATENISKYGIILAKVIQDALRKKTD
jgi:GntR family transcriptional regulator/MocR family aminotransferase